MSTTTSTNARIVGLDIARGIAIIGMIIAHLALPQQLVGEAFSGFPSSLFALLSGVSLAIMAKPGYQRPLAVRGLILLLLWLCLLPLGGGIVIVLNVFGLCFILFGWLPRLKTLPLAVVTFWLWVASAASSAYDLLATGNMAPSSLLFAILRGPYPLFAWATYMALGILAYRLLMHSSTRQWITLGLGISVALAGTAARFLLGLEPSDNISSNTLLINGLINPAAHTGGLIDVATTSAGALAVLSLCLLLPESLKIFAPVAAMGSMPLTSYILHIVSFGLVLSVSTLSQTTQVIISVAVLMVFAALLRHYGHKGPAEYALTHISQRFRKDPISHV